MVLICGYAVRLTICATQRCVRCWSGRNRIISEFANDRKMAVKKKGKTKMAVYRSKHTGKIYTVAEWPDTHLGIIMVKDNMAAPEHRDYKIGPFGSREIAARLLKERAEWLGWEEIKDD